jgi:hypothetical protein
MARRVPALAMVTFALKRTIMLINVLFLILGIILTSVGGAGQANRFAVFAGNKLPTGILVVGIFIMMVSILGCYGARSENRPMLGIYAVILVILIICQFSIGVAVYVQQDQAPVVLRAAWNIANNYQRVVIQNQLECCGCDVYNQTTPGARGKAGKPCPDPVAFPESNGRPCMALMLAQIQHSYVTVGVVAVVFAFIQIIGLSFAFCLIRGIQIARDQHQMVDQEIDIVSAAGAKDTPPNFQ